MPFHNAEDSSGMRGMRGRIGPNTKCPRALPAVGRHLPWYDTDDGVHGHAASRQECCTRARRMLLKGLNRRRQRPSDTWQGSKEVLERLKVARPRIVGRPKTRQAVLKASADLRKRVWLKSPVRANRTPGSVRGRSGNWPSYRDGAPRGAGMECRNDAPSSVLP